MIHPIEKQQLFSAVLCSLKAIPSFAFFVFDLKRNEFSLISDSLKWTFGFHADEFPVLKIKCFKYFVHPNDHFKIFRQFVTALNNAKAIGDSSPVQYDLRVRMQGPSWIWVRCYQEIFCLMISRNMALTI